MSAELESNPLRDPAFAGARDPRPRRFHRTIPGYAPTPLVDAPALADRLGVGRVWLKAELERFGLPSFKVLGASWAAARLLGDGARSWEELVDRVAGRPLTLVTATDGNHGRGVARVARLLELGAHVLVPAGTARARIDGIAGEGAAVTVVDGDYDAAVAAAAALAGDGRVVLSDTSWPGYEDVPRWVAEGYATIFAEVDDQLAEAGGDPPDLAVVPIGVGALAATAASWLRAGDRPPRLLGVEPRDAACVLASARAGRPVTVPGPHRSIMAGLNCGTPSPVAWPDLSRGFDCFCAIDDGDAEEGMRRLAALGVRAGECSGGTVGALLALRDRAPVAGSATVLALLTEGVTDPATWSRVTGG